MAWWDSTGDRRHIEVMAAIKKLSNLINERLNTMATKDQLDRLRVDVAKLIEAAVAEIKAAVDTAQNASPDPAIDALDASVNETTQKLTEAAAALRNPTV